MEENQIQVGDVYIVAGMDSHNIEASLERFRKFPNHHPLENVQVRVIAWNGHHCQVQLLPEYEDRWPQQVFFLQPNALFKPATDEEINAAKQALTDAYRTLKGE